MNECITTYKGSMFRHHGKQVKEFGFCTCPDCKAYGTREVGRDLRYNVLLEDGRRLEHVRPESLVHKDEEIGSIQADFEAHSINGYVANGDSIHCQLISQIVGNLWMGGCIDQVRLPDSFDTVISLYPWEKYILGPTTTRHEYRMHDSGSVPPWEELEVPIYQTLKSLQDGKKTLIHCQAGLNRSGLITALVMAVNPKRPPERTMEGIISKLRDRRHRLVLCNKTFESYLLKNF